MTASTPGKTAIQASHISNMLDDEELSKVIIPPKMCKNNIGRCTCIAEQCINK